MISNVIIFIAAFTVNLREIPAKLYNLTKKICFMCGINGFSFRNEELAGRMNDIVRHRGPDDDGVFSDGNVTLGHRRLKIIDLSKKASQPMSDSEGSLWITFNGEMYNFKEVRKDLEDKGYEFVSMSDTEVILYAYREWGTDCVKRFNGMWAFALYDKKNGIIFMSRDRLGKKPLYYTVKDGNIIFSSEIKPIFEHKIEKKLNMKAVSSFLSYRYVLGKETMFDGVFKLLPAHNMIFNMGRGEIERVWEYWDIERSTTNPSEADALKNTEDALLKSISYRQISDVPIGSINSGGLDSSLVTAMMSTLREEPVKSFTVKFPEEGFDETPFARMLANHCKTMHKEITIDTSNFMNLMKEYVKNKDMPTGVPNEIALYMLFKEIKKSATVVLSGEGADELFAGYSRIFRSPFDFERMKEAGKNYPEKYPALAKKYNGKMFKDELDHFLFLYSYFPDDEKNSFLREEARKDFRSLFEEYYERIDGDYYRRISYIFLKLHLPVLLARLDNSSMRSAVEGRTPFLDYNVVDTIFSMPFSMKNPWKSEDDKKEAESKNCDEIAEKHDTVKYILKRVAEKYIPMKIIERKKQGFPLPLQKWFGKDLLNDAKILLLSEESRISMVANQEKLGEWIKKKEDGGPGFGQKLWTLVSLELWLREWF